MLNNYKENYNALTMILKCMLMECLGISNIE